MLYQKRTAFVATAFSYKDRTFLTCFFVLRKPCKLCIISYHGVLAFHFVKVECWTDVIKNVAWFLQIISWHIYARSHILRGHGNYVLVLRGKSVPVPLSMKQKRHSCHKGIWTGTLLCQFWLAHGSYMILDINSLFGLVQESIKTLDTTCTIYLDLYIG